MVRHRWSKAVCLITVLLHLTGCGWWGDDHQDEVDDVFPELGAASEMPGSGDRGEADGFERPGLQFRVGDRFPLLKTVQQTLTQENGRVPNISRSQLDVQIVLSVEEVRDDRTRLGVHFHRVHFSQELAGESVVYDSSQPTSPIPEAVRPYKGLAHNGFSFWLGPDNQIDELVGFEDFVQRCVNPVAPEQRAALLTELTAFQAEEGVANFVDDSIGLLPNAADGTQLTTGYSWDRTRQLVQPLSMNLRTKYTLQNIDEQVAEIDVLGTISPATSASESASPGGDSGVHLAMRKGHVYGSCTIDRRTGLPVRSEIVRKLTMRVQLPDGQEFEQCKETVTRIRAFPEQNTIETAGGQGRLKSGLDEGVVPAASFDTQEDSAREIGSRATDQTRSLYGRSTEFD